MSMNIASRVMSPLRIATALLGLALPVSTALDNFLLAIVLLGLFSNAAKVWQIALSNPVARVASMLFGLLGLGALYGHTPISESLGILGKYIDLAFIPLFMLMFAEASTRIMAERIFLWVMGLTLLFSYLLNWHVIAIQPWMSIFSLPDNPVVFRSHITQNNMMAYAAFLALLKCRDATALQSRWVWAGYAALAVFNVMFMVQGRTGYVILLLLLCWFAWASLSRRAQARGKAWGWKQGGAIGIAATLLVGGAYLGSARLHDRVDVMVQEFQSWQPNQGLESSSIGERLDFYSNTLQIVQRNWWAGVGTGGFPDAYEAQIQGTNAIPTRNPHNEYLMIAVQTGVLGLLLLLYLYYTQWRVAPSLESPYAQDAARGLVLAFVVNCAFNSALHDHADGLFFAFMSALWFSTWRDTRHG